MSAIGSTVARIRRPRIEPPRRIPRSLAAAWPARILSARTSVSLRPTSPQEQRDSLPGPGRAPVAFHGDVAHRHHLHRSFSPHEPIAKTAISAGFGARRNIRGFCGFCDHFRELRRDSKPRRCKPPRSLSFYRDAIRPSIRRARAKNDQAVHCGQPFPLRGYLLGCRLLSGAHDSRTRPRGRSVTIIPRRRGPSRRTRDRRRMIDPRRGSCGETAEGRCGGGMDERARALVPLPRRHSGTGNRPHRYGRGAGLDGRFRVIAVADGRAHDRRQGRVHRRAGDRSAR